MTESGKEGFWPGQADPFRGGPQLLHPRARAGRLRERLEGRVGARAEGFRRSQRRSSEGRDTLSGSELALKEPLCFRHSSIVGRFCSPSRGTEAKPLQTRCGFRQSASLRAAGAGAAQLPPCPWQTEQPSRSWSCRLRHLERRSREGQEPGGAEAWTRDRHARQPGSRHGVRLSAPSGSPDAGVGADEDNALCRELTSCARGHDLATRPPRAPRRPPKRGRRSGGRAEATRVSASAAAWRLVRRPEGEGPRTRRSDPRSRAAQTLRIPRAALSRQGHPVPVAASPGAARCARSCSRPPGERHASSRHPAHGSLERGRHQKPEVLGDRLQRGL
nr:uncharacterized protein LOC105878128 [Microcebus murinus]